MAINYERIGKRIQQLRKMKKMSQADLAEFAGVSVSYISHIETGMKKASLESVVHIANALGTTVDQLLNGNQTGNQHEYKSELHVFYHPMNKDGKGAQRLFEGNVGLIYPDFISRNSETRMIADAKYKPIDNIGNRDYLQVLAYMFRFDATTGYYLYPEAGDSDDLKLRMNRGSTYEANVAPRDDISVTKHGLKIPVGATNYAEFVVKMKIAEQEFLSAFN